MAMIVVHAKEVNFNIDGDDRRNSSSGSLRRQGQQVRTSTRMTATTATTTTQGIEKEQQEVNIPHRQRRNSPHLDATNDVARRRSRRTATMTSKEQPQVGGSRHHARRTTRGSSSRRRLLLPQPFSDGEESVSSSSNRLRVKALAGVMPKVVSKYRRTALLDLRELQPLLSSVTPSSLFRDEEELDSTTVAGDEHIKNGDGSSEAYHGKNIRWTIDLHLMPNDDHNVSHITFSNVTKQPSALLQQHNKNDSSSSSSSNADDVHAWTARNSDGAYFQLVVQQCQDDDGSTIRHWDSTTQTTTILHELEWTIDGLVRHSNGFVYELYGTIVDWYDGNVEQESNVASLLPTGPPRVINVMEISKQQDTHGMTPEELINHHDGQSSSSSSSSKEELQEDVDDQMPPTYDHDREKLEVDEHDTMSPANFRTPEFIVQAVKEHEERTAEAATPSTNDEGEDSTDSSTRRQRRRTQNRDDGSRVDVMVLYTDEVYGLLGRSEANVNMRIASMQFWNNLAYVQSGIDTMMHIVHTRRLAPSEYSEFWNARLNYDWMLMDLTFAGTRVRLDDGRVATVFNALDFVLEERNAVQADVVVLLVWSPIMCGVAWVNDPPSPRQEGWAYSVVNYACVDAFAHEIGHNFGLKHNRENSPAEDGSDRDQSNVNEFPGRNYGYRVPGVGRTIMSYGCQPPAEECPVEPLWSSPSLNFVGTDIPAGNRYHDTKNYLEQYMRVYANWR